IRLTLIFDMEDRLILKYEDLVEETIRIASSLSARLAKSRMSFRIISNAVNVHGSGPDARNFHAETTQTAADTAPAAKVPFSMMINAESRDITFLNQALARMDSTNIALEMETLLGEEAVLKKSGHTYVFISKNREDTLLQSLRRLAKANNEVLWVLPIRPADAALLTSFNEPGIKRILWEI
ncbi:MAG: hypothetical protein K2P50_10790, partial [Lachnospiraceae bacterium]|nr:hypothetical protein [Lachnospiraceae bacterium]